MNTQLEGLLIAIVDLISNRFADQVCLNPGASSSQLLELETVLGFTISSDLRDFLSFANGECQSSLSPLLTRGDTLLGTSDIFQYWLELTAISEKSASLDKIDPSQWEFDRRVLPSHWRRRWIPIMQSDVIWAIDMEPAPAGKVGQVIFVSWDDVRIHFGYPSLAALFEDALLQLSDGQRIFQPKWDE